MHKLSVLVMTVMPYKCVPLHHSIPWYTMVYHSISQYITECTQYTHLLASTHFSLYTALLIDGKLQLKHASTAKKSAMNKSKKH